jgi:hypothetical protein
MQQRKTLLEATKRASEQADRHTLGGGMGDELIPPDVREFILRHIDSIAHLEALLLLQQQPDIRWNAASVADPLYIEPEQATEVLQHLCETGLAGCDGAVYWFNTEPPGQVEVVRRLAELYSNHLIPVTNLVHSKPSGIRKFAAAFKFRRDK